jgi:Protein of unknown function (DUF3800)
MLLAYVDESGDDGRKKGSHTYTLGCVMVETSAWTSVFDQLIAHRRWVRDRFGIPVRAEIKANYLIRNGGPFRANPISERARFSLYRSFLRLQPKLGLHTFAVVINKEKAAQKFSGVRPASDIAWEYLLQRLERRATKSNPKREIMIVHDEGDESSVRKRARKARRAGTAGSAFGTGQLKRPFTQLIEDPVPRSSHQSYFLQLADLNAYAAFRRLYPPPPRQIQIVPHTMWDELGSARFRPVRSLYRGGPVGIVPGP